jgi:hypothetical protein
MTNADTHVRNCTIIDCVAGRPTKRAGICIRGGRVQACGTEEAVRRAARPDIEEIDLAGAYVMPGVGQICIRNSLSLPGDAGDRVIAMDADPSRDICALRALRWVMKGGQIVQDDR